MMPIVSAEKGTSASMISRCGLRLWTVLCHRHRTEDFAEAWNGVGLDPKAGRAGMPAVAHQMRRAFFQRLVELKTGNRAPRALAMRLSVAKGDHEHRPSEFVHKPAGHDSQQARMPFMLSQNQCGKLRELFGDLSGFGENPPLDLLAFKVMLLQLGR